jgi:hypothetical protein
MKQTLTGAFILMLVSTGLKGDEIYVQAGENTITAALATAQGGDVLVLVEEGVYSNDPLFIYKPVTIKAFSGLVNKPVISFLWSADTLVIPNQERTLAFTYASLTLEGIEFTMEGDSALTAGLTTRMFRNRAYKGVNWKFSDCLFRDASQATMSITGVVDSFMVADGSWHYDSTDYIDNYPFVIEGDTVAQSGLFGVLDTLIIDNSVFKNFLGGGPKINHAPGHGRGVYSYTQFTNNTVSNTDHHTIQIRMRDVNEGNDDSLYGTAVFDHNTIHGVGGNNRKGIFFKFVNPASYIKNTTISDVSGNAINCLSTTAVDYCNWYNVGTAPVNKWVDGGHNVQVDPLFTNASTGDFTLPANSPLIHAGSDSSGIGDPRWDPTTNHPPVNSSAPVLSGTFLGHYAMTKGDMLNVNNGIWTDEDNDTLTFTYNWYRDSDGQGYDGTKIVDASDSTYTLTDAYLDQYIYAVVIANDAKGGIVSASSNYSKQVTKLGVGDEVLLTEFSLSQNYPNPFNPVTQISFAVPNAGDISLRVFNMIGREVALIARGHYPAGLHTATFVGRDLPSGIYFYTLTGDGVTFTKKMILMK